jgi:hypothetical protein
VSFEDGLNYGPAFSKGSDNRGMLSMVLVAGFEDGSIECTQKYPAPELKIYVSGLISNWLRKDKRLNGGVKYEAKNPGSRAHCKDEMLAELRKLRTVVQDETILAEIEGHIAARTTELTAAKMKKTTIDFDKIPAELRAKLNK